MRTRILSRRLLKSDTGAASLPELLVGILLVAFVAAMVTTTVVRANHTTTSLRDSVYSESQLNDALMRISRDVASGTPILHTDHSPSGSELWLQFDNGMGPTQADNTSHCVRTRYYVAKDAVAAATPGGSTAALKSDTYTYPSAACPDPNILHPSDEPTPATAIIVKGLVANGAKGFDVFTYYSRDNTPLTVPSVTDPATAVGLSARSTRQIARVGMSVGATVNGRSTPLILRTAVAPRSLTDNTTDPSTSSVPLPDCVEAGFTAYMDSADPSAPVLSWNKPNNADYFTVTRTTSDTRAFAAAANGTPLRNSKATGFTDEALRGYWSIGINYTLSISGPGGIVDCPIVLLDTPSQPKMNSVSPILSAAVSPTSLNPSSAKIASTAVALSWTSPANSTSFTLESQNPSTGVWTTVQNSSATGSNTTLALDTTGVWRVTAVSTLYHPTASSKPSPTQTVLAHAAAPTLTSATPDANGTFTLKWTATGKSDVTGYAIWYSTNNGSTWTQETTAGATATSGTYAGCAKVATNCRYGISSLNTGQRGTTAAAGTQWSGNATSMGSSAVRYRRYIRKWTYQQYTPNYYSQEFHWSRRTTGHCWFPPGQDQPWSSQAARWVPQGVNIKATAAGKDCGSGSGMPNSTTKPYFKAWSQRGQCDKVADSASVQACWIGGYDYNFAYTDYDSASDAPVYNGATDYDNGEIASGGWSLADQIGGATDYSSSHVPTGSYYTKAPDGNWVAGKVPSQTQIDPPQAYDKVTGSPTDTAENAYTWATTAPGASQPDADHYYTWKVG